MWQGVVEWVGQLLVMVVLFSLVDLMVPENALRGLVRTIMGLAIIATVLGPVVGFVEDSRAWQAAMVRWGTGSEEVAAAPEPAVASARWARAVEAMQTAAADGASESIAREIRALLELTGYRVVGVEVEARAGRQPATSPRPQRIVVTLAAVSAPGPGERAVVMTEADAARVEQVLTELLGLRPGVVQVRVEGTGQGRG